MSEAACGALRVRTADPGAGFAIPSPPRSHLLFVRGPGGPLPRCDSAAGRSVGRGACCVGGTLRPARREGAALCPVSAISPLERAVEPVGIACLLAADEGVACELQDSRPSSTVGTPALLWHALVMLLERTRVAGPVVVARPQVEPDLNVSP